MKLAEIRDELRRAREHVLAGEAATAVAEIDRVLAELAPPRLVTPAEAAALLGVRSDLTVKLWCRKGSLQCETVDGCWMVPLSEVDRFADSDEVREVQALDRLHDLTAELGSDEIDDEWLEDLSASRPGKLPWQE